MKNIGASIMIMGLFGAAVLPLSAQTVNSKPQQPTTQPATEQKQPTVPTVPAPATPTTQPANSSQSTTNQSTTNSTQTNQTNQVTQPTNTAQPTTQPTRSAQTATQPNQPAMQAAQPTATAQTANPQRTAAQPISTNSNFSQGYMALRSGQLDEAQKAFDQGVAADKKDLINTVGQGGVALARGDVNKAKEIFADVEKKAKKKHPEWLYQMAEMYTMSGNKQYADEALRLINTVLDDSKAEKKAEYYIVKGNALRMKNQGGDAVSAYESALQLQPNNAQAITQVGKIFKASKNYNNARDYFVKAIGIDSTYAPAYEELGDLYSLGRNYRSAAFNYKKAIDNSENVPDSTLLNYTKLAFLAEDYKNMMTYLDRIQDKQTILNTNPVRRMYAYAYVSDDYKQYDKALELMKQVLASPGTSKGDTIAQTLDYAALGQAYANLEGEGYDSLAIDYLTKASADTAKNFYGDIANLYYTKKKNYASAARAYEQANQWKQTHNQKVASQDYFNLGRSAYFGFTINKDSTLISKADSAFAMLSETNPSYGGSYLWRARVNRYMPDSSANTRALKYYQDFASYADTVSASSPNKVTNKDLAEANSFIGYNYYNQNNAEKAMPYLNKALELDPENKMAIQLVENINKSKTVAKTGKTQKPVQRAAPRTNSTPKKGGSR